MIHVIDPFAEAHPTWLGLAEDGLRRKVFKVVDGGLLGSEFLTGGLTIFEPGEASSLHNHPDSEEINFIVRGSGEVVAEGGGADPVRPAHFHVHPQRRQASARQVPDGSRCG